MKSYIWMGAGLAVVLAGGVAMAQMPPGDGKPPMAGMDGGGMGQGAMGPGGGERGSHGHGWMHGMMARHMPPPSKAAHFRFRKGDAVVDIKCADDEPTKACVEAGSALMDKLAATTK
jgi:hypothetical protein